MSGWLNTILVVGSLVSVTLAFIWVAIKVGQSPGPKKTRDNQDLAGAAEDDVEHIFNDEFREELRNRGRLHFEKIISDSAMFLQQDLRLTASQINEFMKKEITSTLQETFTKYEESIMDAKQVALETIKKTQESVEEQRVMMNEQVRAEIEKEKKRTVEQFDKNLSEIVNHYLIAAIGNQVSIDDQMDFILGELENNKQQILEDIKSSY
ncbi:hypothetical protein A3F37_01760 [Candidatus Saccharibacteria bacterium RIFCSPHIGHO2_12_FULL_41_12]|nr:MAG: hypothetical protein A3F37_01760 [Candidatus Saccharibacteria bacterium RIFCSPHIGHO2_12_FULL_41_12]